MKRILRVFQRIFSVVFMLALSLPSIQPAAAQQGGGERIKRHPQTGKVAFIGAPAGKPLLITGAQGRGLAQKDRALAIVEPYAADLGLKEANRELTLKKAESIGTRQITRFQQTYQDIPVIAGELVVNATDQGGLISINGEIAPDLALDTQATLTAAQAQQAALEALAKWNNGEPSDFETTEPELWIYDSRLLQPDGRPAALVWRMDVTSKDSSLPVDELVLVDAHRGNIALHFSQVHGMLPLQPGKPTAELSASQGVVELLAADTHYVATNGTDTGDCTNSASPCRTINYAIGQATAGDTVKATLLGMFTGTGSNPVVTINKAITLSGGWDTGFTTQSGMSLISGENVRQVVSVTATGTVTISRFSILYGHATGNGGGILAGGTGALVLESCTLRGNSATGNGGGLYVGSGGANINNSSFYENSADGNGGGAYLNGTTFIGNSTIFDNTASSYGAGLYFYSTATVNNSTIVDNSGGDGLFVSIGTLTLSNSIIAQNAPSNCDGSIIGDHNLAPGCSFFSGSGNITGDPGLLAFPIHDPPYYPLTASSAAIDAGNPSTCLATDQRGVARPLPTSCDIGAFEYGTTGTTPFYVVDYQGSSQAIHVNAPAGLNLIALVLDSTGAPVPSEDVTFTAPATGPSGTFSNGTGSIAVATDGDGIADPGLYTANNEQGYYSVGGVTGNGAGSPASLFNGLINTAADVRTYSMNHSENDALLPGSPVCDLSDYNCTDGIDADADSAEVAGLKVYEFYRQFFGRNSLNDAGMPIIMSVHYGTNFENSAWFAGQAVFGDGWSLAEDVVAHELSHGVTEHTSGLFYYYQSGAIDESISDLFAEVFQQVYYGEDPAKAWVIGEDIPGYPNGVLSMSDPPAFGAPDKMSSPYYDFDEDQTDWGGVHRNAGINNKAAYLLIHGDTFNSKTVTPIGNITTLSIYYEAQRHLLTSGSDYADLYVDLYQACLNLAGGPEGVTLAHCQQVQNAVDAVEMNAQPVAGYNPESPICASGNAPQDVFYDGFENGSGNWVTNSSRWTLGSPYGPYAHSGLQFLYGDDYPEGRADVSVAMKNAVTVPANARLHFAHAYDFEHYGTSPVWYDGGVLEYTTNNRNWIDAGPLMESNGYKGQIVSGAGNPLGGRWGFVGASNGYISSSLNLSTLAGQSVKFRWRMGLDYYIISWGWWLDDVRIYTCAPFTGHTISGNAGAPYITLKYHDGTDKTVTADGTGNYSIRVPDGWSGDVVPSTPGYWFVPTSRTYADLHIDRLGQTYTPIYSWAGGVSITSNRPVVAVGRPHVGAEVASYGGFASGSLRMYLPMLFSGAWGAYDAALYVQNVNDTNSASVTINYYDQGGNLTCSRTDTIPKLSSHGYWIASECVPPGWVGGAVVTSSSSPIVAIARPHVGAQVMTYDGFSSGSLSSYLPMLFKNAWGSYDSAFYVQNVDDTHDAHVTVEYYDTSGNLTCTKDVDIIPPLASHGTWVPSEPPDCLPEGWVGGAVITSSDYPIVAVARPHIGAQVTTYNGFASGSLSSYVPMLFKAAFGGSYNAALYVQALDPDHEAHITINYYDSSGNLTCGPISDTISPLSSHGYWVPNETCLPAGWVGGAMITSSDYPIVAVGRPHVGAEVTAYNGFSTGNTTASLPMLFKNMWGSYHSAFYVQNTDPGGPADVTIKFYDVNGNLSCTRTDSIPALATMGYWVPSVECDP